MTMRQHSSLVQLEAPPPTLQEAEPLVSAARKLWNLVRWSVFLVPLAPLGFITWAIWTRTARVPYWDEWDTVTLVQRVVHRTATLGDFFAFHAFERRIIIPRLVDVSLILVTHWNRHVEMTVDLLVAVGELVLLWASLRRIVRSTKGCT